MKKILVTVFVLCISISAFAQEEDNISQRHEIKLNLLYSVLAIPEISYEYALNEESAIGTSILITLDKDIDIKFAATPYYRYYFSKKPTAGFFIEGFGMYSIEEDLYETSTSDFALGVSIGVKLLSKRGFVGELYAGLGRNLFGNHDVEGVPRIGISFGKRF